MVCKNCNSSNEGNAIKCNSCGSSLLDENASNDISDNALGNTRKKKSRRKIVLIILGVLIVLLLIIEGVFLYLKDKDKKQKELDKQKIEEKQKEEEKLYRDEIITEDEADEYDSLKTVSKIYVYKDENGVYNYSDSDNVEFYGSIVNTFECKGSCSRVNYAKKNDGYISDLIIDKDRLYLHDKDNNEFIRIKKQKEYNIDKYSIKMNRFKLSKYDIDILTAEYDNQIFYYYDDSDYINELNLKFNDRDVSLQTSLSLIENNIIILSTEGNDNNDPYCDETYGCKAEIYDFKNNLVKYSINSYAKLMASNYNYSIIGMDDYAFGFSSYVINLVLDKDLNVIYEDKNGENGYLYGLDDFGLSLVLPGGSEFRYYTGGKEYKRSKKYDYIWDVRKDVVLAVENNKIVLVDATNDTKLATFADYKRGISDYHEALSGWYTENKKSGWYFVIDGDIPKYEEYDKETLKNWGVNSLEEYENFEDSPGENGSRGYEYYYIPSTKESGKIPTFGGSYAKPVLYLYPKKDNTKVNIKFAKPSLLTTTYPKYISSWNVVVDKNGNMTDSNNKEYYGLYWEEDGCTKVDFKEGFYVTKDNAIDFLENSLSELGFTRREANEFIMYWLPILEKNKKSLVYFETTESRQKYNELQITPKPDSMLRVAIHVKKVDEKINIKKQVLPKFNRKGFAAIEWGGTVY